MRVSFLRPGAAGVGSLLGRGVAGGCGLLLAAALLVAVPFERGDAAAASPVSTAGGVVSPAAALTFTNYTTANGLGSNSVRGVYAVGSTVYAATGGGVSISTNIDDSPAFTNRTLLNSGLGSNDVRGVYAVAGSPHNTVYAATNGGLSISTDGGTTFTNRTTTNGLGSNIVYGVYAVGSTVYAATNGGLSISTNIDDSPAFTNITSGLGSPQVTAVYAVAGTPHNTVYVGTINSVGGVAVSTDGGANFTNSTSGLANTNVFGVSAVGSTVYAATLGGGLSISTNVDDSPAFTNNRTVVNSGLGGDSVYEVYAVGTTVYAGTSGGLSVSINGGTSFTNYTTTGGLGSNTVLGVYAVGGTVYAATTTVAGIAGGLSISGSSLPALTASPSSASVVAGATGTVTISSTARPLLDDSAVTAVSAAPGVATVTSSNNPSGGTATFTVTGVTAGTSNVTFSAAGYANVVVPVTVTAPSPGPGPGPAPVFPPSAPASVSGVAGDGSAVLSWTAPASAGSFPISNYQAVVSPGGRTCVVAAPAVTCTISGLTNGTSYTATVRALNGAGWGANSTASAAFTPEQPVTPSITITGTRADVRGRPGVVVTGTTTGFGMGAILRPWTRFPGQASYTQGSASILVDSQGDFTWERRTGKTIHILIRSEDATVESNRLILRAT